MPLSEEEQRILGEIEQQLYASDPDLAKEIADSTVYRHAARNLKWAIAGFLLGTVILLGTLHISFVLAFLGFVVLLVCTLSIVRDLRLMGKAGMSQLSESMRSSGLRNSFGSTGQRMRERFRRDDE
jgi:small-conductance mechanosensitive channel